MSGAISGMATRLVLSVRRTGPKAYLYPTSIYLEKSNLRVVGHVNFGNKLGEEFFDGES